MSKKKTRTLVGMYDVLGAVESAIESASPEARRKLVTTLKEYCDDFPEEFFWAIGPQAPTLLNHLLIAVTPTEDVCPACQTKEERIAA